MGVDHIFIFEDVDSDTHMPITEKYSDITLMNVKDVVPGIMRREYNHGPIQQVYIHKAFEWVKENYGYEWIFLLDTDEFITSTIPLVDILPKYSDYECLLLQWENYGANGIDMMPSYKSKGVVDTYTTPIGFPTERLDVMTKPCFNMRRMPIDHISGQHSPSIYDKWCFTDFSKNYRDDVDKNFYIRHYITKSWEEWIVKMEVRGMFNKGHRIIDDFFAMNPDMLPRRAELISLIPEIVRKHTKEKETV